MLREWRLPRYRYRVVLTWRAEVSMPPCSSQSWGNDVFPTFEKHACHACHYRGAL
jgi:hypothetical protein